MVVCRRPDNWGRGQAKGETRQGVGLHYVNHNHSQTKARPLRPRRCSSWYSWPHLILAKNSDPLIIPCSPPRRESVVTATDPVPSGQCPIEAIHIFIVQFVAPCHISLHDPVAMDSVALPLNDCGLPRSHFICADHVLCRASLCRTW